MCDKNKRVTFFRAETSVYFMLKLNTIEEKAKLGYFIEIVNLIENEFN